jgi:YidC/Oxa1 family membrane protein insertase
VSIPLLDPLYEAVAWVIMRLHAVFGALFGPSSGWAWALTIVFLVIIMRLILVPLFIKQMHATRKMTALAPQVAELKKKYKGDRQKLNEETMKLYKENGANPLAGCLPVVAQLPVFFALFGVLRAISLDEPKYGLTPAVVHSAQTAHILGVTVADRLLSKLLPPTFFPLNTEQRIVILLTVVVSATTTFMTVRQSMKRGMTPQVDPDNPMASSQKMMQYIVPVFALSGLYWQYGLVMYWVTTNLWTLGQQYVLFKRFPPPVPAGAAAGAAALTGKPGGKQASGGPARTGGTVTAAGRAAARQQQGAKAASGKAAPARPTSGKAAAARATSGKPAGQAGKTPASQPASTAAPAPSGQADKQPINQLRKPAAKPSVSGPAKSAGGAAKPAGAAAKPAKAAAGSGPAKGSGSNGNSGGGGGAVGGLRRLVKGGRAEAEPPPAAEPETKIVRQQPVRQSRSRRSGKR